MAASSNLSNGQFGPPTGMAKDPETGQNAVFTGEMTLSGRPVYNSAPGQDNWVQFKPNPVKDSGVTRIQPIRTRKPS